MLIDVEAIKRLSPGAFQLQALRASHFIPYSDAPLGRLPAIVAGLCVSTGLYFALSHILGLAYDVAEKEQTKRSQADEWASKEHRQRQKELSVDPETGKPTFDTRATLGRLAKQRATEAELHAKKKAELIAKQGERRGEAKFKKWLDDWNGERWDAEDLLLQRFENEEREKEKQKVQWVWPRIGFLDKDFKDFEENEEVDEGYPRERLRERFRAFGRKMLGTFALSNPDILTNEVQEPKRTESSTQPKHSAAAAMPSGGGPGWRPTEEAKARETIATSTANAQALANRMTSERQKTRAEKAP